MPAIKNRGWPCVRDCTALLLIGILTLQIEVYLTVLIDILHHHQIAGSMLGSLLEVFLLPAFKTGVDPGEAAGCFSYLGTISQNTHELFISTT